MTETALRGLLASQIADATGYIDGELIEERREALDYYYGEPFGNEVDGRSQVVSQDVQDTIESIMPDLVEMFAATDDVVRFEPKEPEDEAIAGQASDYVNFIWMVDNPGFEIIHDWLKDAALQKFGVIKQWWDETPVTRKETLTGVNALRLMELEADESVEILAFTEKDSEYEEKAETPQDDLMQDPMADQADQGPTYEVKIERTISKGKVRIECIPPEEFLVQKRSTSLRDADFLCHRMIKTQSELIEMGYERDLVESLPSDGEGDDFNGERDTRFNNESSEFGQNGMDRSMRRIRYYECYMMVDYDGDGVAEMRQICAAGTKHEILHNIEVAEHPFDGASPIRVPHRLIGRAIADLAKDIQLIKSTVQRQILDNMYFSTNARALISDRVNLDDWLTNRPGGAVRVDAPSVQGHYEPILTAPLGPQALPIIEYFDQVRESRTGISRLNQGLDPESLNKTATGVNLLLGRTQKRVLLIARLFAEIGFKEAVKRTLRLITTHQDKERTIRLRNQWVTMDPSKWNPDMDVSVSVGLGFGSKEQQSAQYMQVLQVFQPIVEGQGGADGPLVTSQNLYEVLKRLMQSFGIRNLDQLISNPQMMPPQQPKVDPKVQVEMQRMQMDGQKAQAELQIDVQKMNADIQLQREKMMADVQLERERMAMEFQQKAQLAEADRTVNTGLEEKRIEASSKPTTQIALPDGVGEVLTQLVTTQSQGMDQAIQTLANAAQMIAQAVQLMNMPKEIVIQGQNGQTKRAVARPMMQ